MFSNEPLFNKINNDYNVKFLPKTEFLELSLEKRKINFKKDYYNINLNKQNISYGKYGTFFIDINKDELIITDYLGNFYFAKTDLILEKDNLLFSSINSNLQSIERVYDVLIIKNKIFVSFVKEIKNCRKIYVKSAIINKDFLNFEELFESKNCNKNASPGRIQFLNKKGEDGILMSVSSGVYNAPNLESQNKETINGKIIFINLFSKNYSIFSLGHRVVQGLAVEKDLIIATEHGPKGGDEINIIRENNNYGWPIASYGEKYDFNYNKKPSYKKNHSKHGFEEPIYTFIPGIGISELIKLPDSFSKMMTNIYLVSSLYGRSIFLVKFDEKFTKVIFSEKIFLNERVRDLKYIVDKKIILMAFEENGEIGILKEIN